MALARVEGPERRKGSEGAQGSGVEPAAAARRRRTHLHNREAEGVPLVRRELHAILLPQRVQALGGGGARGAQVLAGAQGQAGGGLHPQQRRPDPDDGGGGARGAQVLAGAQGQAGRGLHPQQRRPNPDDRRRWPHCRQGRKGLLCGRAFWGPSGPTRTPEAGAPTSACRQADPLCSKATTHSAAVSPRLPGEALPLLSGEGRMSGL